MTEISKALMVDPDWNKGWKAARSLGGSQRALRNSFRKDVIGEAKATRAAQKAGENPSLDKYTEKITGMSDDFKTGREKLRVDQRGLSKPKRLVSNVSQYPARWAGGSTVAAGTGVAAKEKVKKMDTGPFGVEVISKKQCKCDCKDCKTSCGCDCSKCGGVSKAVNPFKAKSQVKSQLKLVSEAKGTRLASDGRGGPKRISYKNTLLNVAGTHARVKSRNGLI